MQSQAPDGTQAQNTVAFDWKMRVDSMITKPKVKYDKKFNCSRTQQWCSLLYENCLELYN